MTKPKSKGGCPKRTKRHPITKLPDGRPIRRAYEYKEASKDKTWGMACLWVRKALNWTQKELAQYLGSTQGMIAAWETEEKIPTKCTRKVLGYLIRHVMDIQRKQRQAERERVRAKKAAASLSAGGESPALFAEPSDALLLPTPVETCEPVPASESSSS